MNFVEKNEEPREQELISVVLAAYNCESYVGEAIDSILGQSYSSIELLVADDASTDRTRAVIDAYSDPRIRRCHNDQNLGYLRTANKLMAQATGDFICFQDADDWSSADRLEAQLAFIREHHLDACGTGISFVDPEGNVQEEKIYPRDQAVILENELRIDQSISYGSIMFSRAVYEAVGGYREFFAFGVEDYDWGMRVIQKFRFMNLQKICYFYRYLPGSITSSVNILKQKSSLRLANELAKERSGGNLDQLELGMSDSVKKRWDDIFAELNRHPLAEDINRINRLLRRHARKEGIDVCLQAMKKDVGFSPKLTIVALTLLKLTIGMKNYERIKWK
ncbi:glycosyltransferase family 2 protein [Haliea sp. E17]|uniref:glycosyltransferase family 2 protein n=1 Tax=Haliea sp. E17 TaxID=3401576 RepID=UPI003AAD0256